VVVCLVEDPFLAVIAYNIFLYAERRNGFRMDHDHRFEGMVKVGIEVEFNPANALLTRPGKRKRRIGVSQIGKPGIGLVRWALGTIRYVTWAK
jgi:hypothetical protein